MSAKNPFFLGALFCFAVHFSAMAVDFAPKKAAIFVENRAGKEFNDKVAVLEDMVGSRITDKGFSVISREVTVNALKDYSTTGKDTAGNVTAVDALFSDNSSALRLGQNIGADYLILVSLLSYGTEKKTFTDNNISTVNVIHNLRASYKIAEAVSGGSLTGDSFKVSKTYRFTENAKTENDDLINELLEEVTTKIVENVGTKKIAPPVEKAGMVEFSVSCGMQDLANVPMGIPDVRTNQDGTISVGKDKLSMEALDATVELNGAIIGSAPGKFKATPGLSKIRISREGFKPWERTINVAPGLNLRVPLQMSEAGYGRWKDNTQFLQDLKEGEKITDAQVKTIEGAAQMLRQSGFKVDLKADIKGDALAKPQVNVFRSLFNE